MIERDFARRLVAEYIEEGCTTSDGVTPVILDDMIIEREFGWVFFYESRESLDAGDFSLQLAGNAPRIVNRRGGSTHETGQPVESYIERCERRAYGEPAPISRDAAERVFESSDVARICVVLVAVTFHEGDWRWVQHRCLRFCKHDDPQIRGVAATCLGHLARIHGRLDLDSVLPCLQELRSDEEVGGRAEDALEYIALFLRR